jgi:hypothetical protein
MPAPSRATNAVMQERNRLRPSPFALFLSRFSSRTGTPLLQPVCQLAYRCRDLLARPSLSCRVDKRCAFRQRNEHGLHVSVPHVAEIPGGPGRRHG